MQRNRMGNLENLNLGMGLSMSTEQILPAKHASLGDFDFSKNYLNIVLLAIGALIFLKYKL